MQLDNFKHSTRSRIQRPVAGVEISCPKIGSQRIHFLTAEREAPNALVQLVVAFISSLWIYHKYEGHLSPSIELILDHARQMRALGENAENPMVWEAIHNVRLTRAVSRSRQSDRLENARIRVFLFERESSLHLISQFELPQEPKGSGRGALLLYEAVAYKLKYPVLLALVEALAGLSDDIETGKLSLANHERIAICRATTALTKYA